MFSKLKNKKVLVTGGAGFIGSHIVEALINQDVKVTVLDNFFSGKESNLSFVLKDNKSITDNFELIRGDIRDLNDCRKAAGGADVIIHQAALRSVPKSMETPYDYNDVNINGTLNLLTAARELGVKRLVLASSSSVYGDTDKFPQAEDAYPLLISPYALSKLAGEYYCRIFAEHFGVETVALRYFNVFGPRQALDDEYAVVIPKFIDCILNDKKPPIFGNGKQSRDFTFIDNVVLANVLAATVDGISKEVFNVANGKDNSVLELVASLNSILGKNIEPEFLPLRAGDVFRTLADISKLKKLTGFSPKVDFEQGLRRTVDYFVGK
ncbi:MAG: SDR family oxidoreductase [Candidatus Omnitrophica bacterium]|nr:SDR family oxidoreductase [Candidatus Omnitrophota bacterium]